MIPRIATVLASLALLPAVAAAEPLRLDDFLAGFGDQCRQTDAFVRFKETMIVFDEGWTLTRNTEIPHDVRPAIGRAEITAVDEVDDFVTVKVPVAGAMYRGLEVKAIRIGFSDGYLLIDDSIIFDAPLEEVEAALAADIAAFDPAIAGEVMELSITANAEGTWLTCFATN